MGGNACKRAHTCSAQPALAAHPTTLTRGTGLAVWVSQPSIHGFKLRQRHACAIAQQGWQPQILQLGGGLAKQGILPAGSRGETL